MNYPAEYYETDYEHKAQLCGMSDIDFKQSASRKIKRAKIRDKSLKKNKLCRKKRSLIKARQQALKDIELMMHNINNETRFGG